MRTLEAWLQASGCRDDPVFRMLKRQTFGRSSFDRLWLRTLFAA
ncbi:hypothetical protein [Paracraurococcus ruber]|nr:hypothetical protein [Paracraurococcus ruber]